jgi:hypothetical protein
MTAKPPADDVVRQLLVHPVVWPDLVEWLDRRGITLGLMPPVKDDLPTWVMTPRDHPNEPFAVTTAPCDTCGHVEIAHPKGGLCVGKLAYGETCGCDDYEPVGGED